MHLNKKLTIVANAFVDGSDKIVATLIDRINFDKRNTSFMMSWYSINIHITLCMICQFVSLKGRLQGLVKWHYFIKYIFEDSKSVSCNVYLGIFTCLQPAFDKYLIALQQIVFLNIDNTTAGMIHHLGRPLSMHM